MTPIEAIKTAQLMLSDYRDCVYDRHTWAAIVRALLPLAVSSLAYHQFIHPHVCGNRLPVNFAELDEQVLWKLLTALCETADRNVQ